MHPDLSQKSRGDVWAWTLMAAGLTFIILLICLTKKDIFFSGDAGLKFLMVRQMEAGGPFANLEAMRDRWVTDIWNAGFFPFNEPFVYPGSEGRIVAFPPAFQWVSLPFYRLLGFRGLYLLPAASVVLLWISFWQFIRGIQIPEKVLILFLAVLIFASPLIVYGGLYWEHSIAVALGFFGVRFVAGRQRFPVLAGLLFGLSAWFRPEMLVFCGLAILSQVISLNRKSIIFISGTTISLVAFFVFNSWVYGHPLGAHALQFLSGEGIAPFKPSFINLFTHLNARLIEFFPSSLLMLLVVYVIFKREVLSSKIYQLTLIITCFLILMPFFIPNAGGKQWGPRYLLPVIPAMLALYAMVYSEWSKRKSASFGSLIKWIWIATLVTGFAMNICWAYFSIRNDYRDRVAPALAWIRADKTSSVIVQNQYISQEMAGEFEEKNFFVAQNDERLAVLLVKLRQAGIKKIIYLSYTDGPGSSPKDLNAKFSARIKKGYYSIIPGEIVQGAR